MATYRILHAPDGVNFERFDAVGVFYTEEDAHVAVDILAKKFGGLFEVVQSTRGRPRGSKDARPRMRRTKVELIAKAMGVQEDDTDEDEPAPPSTVDAEGVEVSPVDNPENDDYTEPSPASFDRMLMEVEAIRSPDSRTMF
jgi:hypothetical protein